MKRTQLTLREQQIADLQRKGLTIHEIALRLRLPRWLVLQAATRIRRKRFMAVCAQVILPGDPRP